MNYWEILAQKTKKKAISSTDPNLDFLERESIKKYLKKTWRVIDVGSGDGLATLEFAAKVRLIEGLEAAPAVIQIAEKNQKLKRNKTVTWREGSAVDIAEIYKGEKFDCLISKRCLINVETWGNQKKAISGMAELLKPGGFLLLCEGFADTFKNLNDLREKHGLERDKVVSFNRYFERRPFEEIVKKDFRIMEQNNFGLYYFLSHFFYPYLIFPQDPKYRSKINQMATKLSLKDKMLEEFGYISFYALKKKS
jgi:ubiquinone/menaquinone biosynthesis C-methylase UbiE